VDRNLWHPLSPYRHWLAINKNRTNEEEDRATTARFSYFSWLSDRVGRRPVYLAGALFSAAFAFPFFWLVNTGSAPLIDGNAVALAGDVRSEAYAKALVALAVEKFGRLDIAFNNAGTLGEAGPSTQVSEAGWNDAIAINLTGSFLGAKHQIAEMLKHGGGSVIFTSTFVGYSFAFPGVAAYAASKSGLIGLTQALAAEFGPRGVRVNAILPGAVETGMYREMNDTADKQAFMTNLHALKRVAQPEELARSVLYLASDDSAFVTGTASLVDGGASITRS
jgi:NAD(P)-dependent dehydrogenase (short-subunit alcohol dehydrogenase family)